MKLRIEGIVYLIGIAVFGIFYYQLKSQFSGPVFLAGGIAYLGALRALGWYLEKRFGSDGADEDGDA